MSTKGGKAMVFSTIWSSSLVISGCVAQRSGTPYGEAVTKVETMLAAKVDAGIMPYTKKEEEGQTAFRFIEGSQWEKVDHVTPLRVTITVIAHEGGHTSAIEVGAYEHGIKITRPDRNARKRWIREATGAVEPEAGP